MVALFAFVALTPQARGARSVETRIAWLKQRVSTHRYICRNGRRVLQSTQHHCQALRWTQRELQEAITEKHQLWYRLPNTNDWETAVAITQRVYPGTSAWLMSCSGGEGGHGKWKPYHSFGSSYYKGYEKTDWVGGWMQYRPSTFKPYYRHAIADLRAKGFTVQLNSSEWLKGWLNPLAQALTAGYMRSIGISHVHWSPSVDYKCR